MREDVLSVPNSVRCSTRTAVLGTGLCRPSLDEVRTERIDPTPAPVRLRGEIRSHSGLSDVMVSKVPPPIFLVDE